MKKTSAILALVLCCMLLLACAAPAAAPAAEPAPAAAAEAAPAAAEAPAEEPAPAAAEEITLDVIICQHGLNTKEWFLGKGMDGANFVDKFESENPGIKLNLEVVSRDEVHTVVDARIAGGQTPDILNADAFADYAGKDLLMPVTEYCPNELFLDFFPSFLDQSVMNGIIWAVPDMASASAMFYNADIFNEVGIHVPATWAELKDACKAIKEHYNGEVYPWGIDMTAEEGQAAFAYYVWGNGGGFVDADNKWAVNSAENAEAIQFALDLIGEGFTNPDPATQTGSDLRDMFAAGKLAMVIAPNQFQADVSAQGGKINVATADIPANEDKASSSVGAMHRMMAFKDGAASDQAARSEAIGKFLTFFYSSENYVGWVSMEGFLPAVNSAVESLVAADPSFAAWLDVLDGCKFYPADVDGWDTVRQGVVTAEQNALKGDGIQDELDALQAELAD